jgi:hypothetical protein
MANPMPPENMARVIFKDLPFLIPLPTANDDLQATAKKMEAIADIISSGGRLKVELWLGAIAQAKRAMSIPELNAFEAWQRQSVPVPTFNWSCTEPVPDEGRQSFRARAAAMDVIWKHNGATAGNAVWLSAHMQSVIPLVKAVIKMIRARDCLALNDRYKGLDQQQIAEAEILRSINVAAGNCIKRDKSRVNTVTYSIHKSQTVLKNRIADLIKDDDGDI